MKTLEKRVVQTIRECRMLVPGDRVGVAVSGGADSVALMRLLLKIRGEIGMTLLVVHFEHGLRGKESTADARFTEDLAKEHGLEFISETADVGSVAAAHKRNIEDAARRLRYDFFDRVVRSGRATRIAVAHTVDDQAETVLAHLFRGTGLTGLAGIHPVIGSIVRPLLGERRKDLHEYLAMLGQTWREDSTNQDESRLRARIRHRLLPVLEREFTSHVANQLASLAELAREEGEFWDALVETRFRALVRQKKSMLAIPVQELLAPVNLEGTEAAGSASPSEPMLALTKRLIRRLYQEVRGDRQGLTAEHVKQVTRLAAQSSSGHRVELPIGVVVERIFGDLVFSRSLDMRGETKSGKSETKNRAATFQHPITLPRRGETNVSVPELKRRFCLKVIDWPPPERETTRENALDAERLCAPIVLRSWRQGDVYRVRGHRHARKLNRMFLEQHVSTAHRFTWPVLESAGRVAWVRGMPPADEFCAGEWTRVGVLIEEKRL